MTAPKFCHRCGKPLVTSSHIWEETTFVSDLFDMMTGKRLRKEGLVVTGYKKITARHCPDYVFYGSSPEMPQGADNGHYAQETREDTTEDEYRNQNRVRHEQTRP